MLPSPIVVKNLVKTFRQRGQAPIHAINGVSFEVGRGSIFGLLGPNGAGKTAMLRVLTTLFRPSEGEVTVEGFDVVQQAVEVRRRISVVIQENAADLFLSVQDNLATFGRFHGLSPVTIRSRIADLLDQFELRAEAGRKVIDLSGGFRRRVQVAKVFMTDSPVIFLDEFSSGMDPLLKRSVMARLREQAAAGRTIVLTTQILSEAEELCGKVLFNLLIAMAQAAITVFLARACLGVPIQWERLLLVAVAVFVGTAGWFFLYAVFALVIRRNDAFNTITSIFYFVFLFASSMFYPVEPLPAVFRHMARANPITWQIDVLRYATMDVGNPRLLWAEAAAFLAFTGATFVAALWALRRQQG